mgnify:CR=1 FL=1|jgi:quercetin dioxygenase-like cupin family protein
MKTFKLSESGHNGWFIGNFPKAVFQTEDFEVCYRTCAAGSRGDSHYHEKLTEVTLIASGKVLTNGQIYTAGDIYILEPNEISQTEYLEETVVITIKTPSVPGDKVLV